MLYHGFVTISSCVLCYAVLCCAGVSQVSSMKTLGKQGTEVYIFGLKRRPGQDPSLSKPVSYGGREVIVALVCICVYICLNDLTFLPLLELLL